MQYSLLRLLASHNHVTIVGDDDQVYLFIFTPTFLGNWFFLSSFCIDALNLYFTSSFPDYSKPKGSMFLQSIFSFNGADISGFDSFRKDFPNYKEVWYASHQLCFPILIKEWSVLIYIIISSDSWTFLILII